MTANFENAYATLQLKEGGYSNASSDRGGETYRGIARKYHSDWEGWTVIDDIKKYTPNLKMLNETLNNNANLQNGVKEFYFINFWKFYRISEIISQEVANKIFDIFVNINPISAGKIVQNSLNEIKKEWVEVDGIIGNKTIIAINATFPAVLLAQLKLNQISHYEREVILNPEQIVNFLGWIRRALK
jgi:lysozyme family protein